MSEEGPVIRITSDDLARVREAPAASESVRPTLFTPPDPAARRYGNINAEPELAMAATPAQRNILLEGWFYLGAAGLLGAVIGWGICEPGFIDAEGAHSWGNTWMLPGLVTMLCLGFGLAESIVERSVRKALIRTALAIPLGVVLGFFFDVFANVIYNVGLAFAFQLGVRSQHNPIFWLARAVGWTAFGAAGGVVYGIIGQSAKKAKYGVLGGMLGAAIGGFIFDPISIGMHAAVLSRAAGFALFGLATGVSIGLVESALKDRWLYVFGGPLAGKQFILYKPVTTVGSRQQCDIYLFKDSSVLPEHAVLETRGNRVQVQAGGPVYVGGQPVHSRVLQNGDLIQIGRYSFRYQEKQRT